MESVSDDYLSEKLYPYQERILYNLIHGKNTLLALPLNSKHENLITAILYQQCTSGSKSLKSIITAPNTERLKEISTRYTKYFTKFSHTIIRKTQSREKRKSLYSNHHILFTSDMVICEDIRENILDIESIKVCIIEDAHKYKRKNLYTKLCSLLSRNANIQIIAISSQPGSKRTDIQALMSSLSLTALEFSPSFSSEMLPYLPSKRVQTKIVPIHPQLFPIVTELRVQLREMYSFLQSKKILQDKEKLTRKNLVNSIKYSKSLCVSEENCEQLLYTTLYLSEILNLLETKGTLSAITYIQNLFLKSNRKTPANLSHFELLSTKLFYELVAQLSKLFRQSIYHSKYLMVLDIIHEFNVINETSGHNVKKTGRNRKITGNTSKMTTKQLVIYSRDESIAISLYSYLVENNQRIQPILNIKAIQKVITDSSLFTQNLQRWKQQGFTLPPNFFEEHPLGMKKLQEILKSVKNWDKYNSSKNYSDLPMNIFITTNFSLLNKIVTKESILVFFYVDTKILQRIYQSKLNHIVDTLILATQNTKEEWTFKNFENQKKKLYTLLNSIQKDINNNTNSRHMKSNPTGYFPDQEDTPNSELTTAIIDREKENLNPIMNTSSLSQKKKANCLCHPQFLKTKLGQYITHSNYYIVSTDNSIHPSSVIIDDKLTILFLKYNTYFDLKIQKQLKTLLNDFLKLSSRIILFLFEEHEKIQKEEISPELLTKNITDTLLEFPQLQIIQSTAEEVRNNTLNLLELYSKNMD